MEPYHVVIVGKAKPITHRGNAKNGNYFQAIADGVETLGTSTLTQNANFMKTTTYSLTTPTKEDEMNHTPTPWQLAGITTERLQGSQRSIEADFIHLEAEGYTAGGGIGLIHNKPNGVGMDNARFILTACNAHEEVVATLKGCLSWLSSYPGGGAMTQYDKVRTLLAAIEKGA